MYGYPYPFVSLVRPLTHTCPPPLDPSLSSLPPLPLNHAGKG